MTINRIQPPDLMPARQYSQVVVAQGSRTVYLAGQVATDASGSLVGGDDLAAQARQVYVNLEAALAAAGAGLDQLVKITMYIVGYKPEHRAVLGAVRSDFFGDTPLPASTLVGVTALADSAYLIEIEGVAVT